MFIFRGIARLATTRPWTIILIMAAIAATALSFSPGLSDRLSGRGFAHPDAESSLALDRLADATGSDVRAEFIALIQLDEPVDSNAGRALVEKVEKRFERDEDVAVVRTPFDADETEKTLISKDGKSAIVVANLEPDAPEDAAYDRLQHAFDRESEVLLGGAEVTQHTVSATIAEDLERAELMAFPLLFLIALFVFRGLIAAFLPILVGAITIPVTFALIRAFDQLTDLSVFALNLTTGLGLGLAIDYSLLLVTRFREEIAAGAETPDAVRRTVATAGRTVAFSAMTVAAAIGAMMIFPLKFLYSMGIGGATVALVSAAVALALVPALLMLLGTRIDRFGIPRRSAEHSMRLWYRLATSVMKRPLLVSIVTIGLLLAMTIPAAKIDFTSVDATVLGKQIPPRVVQETVDNEFPPGDANSAAWVLLKSDRYDAVDLARDARRVKRDARELAADERDLRRDAALLATGAYAADPARMRRKADSIERRSESLERRADRLKTRSDSIEHRSDRLERFTDRVDAYATRVGELPNVERVGEVEVVGEGSWKFDVFPEGGQYSPSAQRSVDQVRALAAPAQRWVGGDSAAFVDQRDSILERTPLALGVIAVFTFVVLFLMTGSVVLPVKTFIMNLLTLGATFGVLVWIFQDGRFESVLDYESQGAMEMTQPVLLFALAFGLATDYGVFLLGRVKEFYDSGMSNADSVATGVSRTGRVISSAAVLFCVAILTFSTSGIVFIKELGVGAALAVAIDASIVRALLVPALMALLGDWNWWSPAWLRKLHARIGIDEGPSAGAPVTPAPLAASAAGVRSGGGFGGGAGRVFGDGVGGGVGDAVPGGLSDRLGDHAGVDDGEQRVDDAGIELGAGVPDHLGSGLFDTDRLAVRAVGDHRVEGVADQDDAASQRNLLTRYAVGVALAVPALVFVANRLRDR